MKLNNKIAFFFPILLIALQTLSSCKKDGQDGQGPEGTSISVRLLGQSTMEARAKGPSLSTGTTLASSSTMERTLHRGYTGTAIMLDGRHYLDVRVVPVTPEGSAAMPASSGNPVTGPGSRASAVSKTSALAPNTAYQVVIYRNNRFVQQRTFSANGNNKPFSGLEPGGGYRVISYSFGNQTVSPVGTSEELAATGPSVPVGDDDRFMYFSTGTFSLAAGSDNPIDILLDNKIAEISAVQLNVASESVPGNIVSIREVKIESNISGSANLHSGNLSYPQDKELKGIPFPANSNGRTVTSSNTGPIKIGLQAAQAAANLLIGSITIGSVTKNDLKVPLPLTQGTRYRIELNIREFTSDGIQIGDLIWAPGNLKAERTNGSWSYGFHSSQENYSANESGGDYWMAGKEIPGRSHTDMNYPFSRYGDYPSGDPCRLVSPEWRTPGDSDFRKLMAGASYMGNPGIPGKYGKNNVSGRYFGPVELKEAPTDPAQQSRYLFLPFTGNFVNYNTGRQTVEGANYWSTNVQGAENYSTLHVRPSYSSLGGWWKVELNPIRCVRDAK